MRDSESVVEGFLSAAGVEQGGRYLLRAEVLARLIGLLTDLGEMRLALLTGLQSALPRSDEGTQVEELKESLTNLIIMQSRTAGRESGIADQVVNLASADEIQPVTVDKDKLHRGLLALVEAADRVRGAGGDSSPGT